MNMQTAETDIMTKAQFAEACNVVPSAVSNWIANGHIGSDALVGDGPRAKIRASLARRDLKKNLDLGQQLGNGATTILEGAEPIEPAAETGNGEPTIEQRLRTAKVIEAETKSRRAIAEEKARQGLYTPTNDARAATVKVAGAILSAFESGLVEIANEFASQFEIPQRDALHLLRQKFRDVRTVTSEQLAAQAADMPELISDEGAG
jgi:hypothetical protein